MQLRPATNADSDAIIALIDKVYREYGEIMFLEGADADLLDIEGRYAGGGGAFVVLEDGAGNIIGSHATSPVDQAAGILTFRRLYLDQTLRGSGHGRQLMDWAVNWSRDHGFQRVEFWSDTRFTPAHAFFDYYGFSSTGEIRDMDDGAAPYSEYFFSLSLDAEK